MCDVDLRFWNREITIEVIERYKSMPCLWKVKCDEYKNKNKKEECYRKLVEFFIKRGFPGADKEFVKKKLQSIRSGFRKEHRKVVEFGSKGVTYVPVLWYYELMTFVKDQDEDTSTIEEYDEDFSSDPLNVTNDTQNDDFIVKVEELRGQEVSCLF